MQRRTLLPPAALLVLIMAGPADAGQVSLLAVTVDTNNDYAYGSVVGARTSANATEYIYCQVSDQNDLYAGPSDARVYCYARNSAGVSRNCFSYDPQQVEIAAGIGPASYIYFNWVEFFGSQICKDIQVRNGSLYLQ